MITPLLLLSDVDGTLIGEDGALPAPPREIRDRLRSVSAAWNGDVQAGFASSRTLRELTVLQRALRLPGPCIAEDGARHAIDVTAPVARGTFDRALQAERHGARTMHTFAHAASADRLREAMRDDPRIAHADTRQLSTAALHALGFRTRGAIRRALEARTHSVLLDPHVWSETDLSELRITAAARGLHLRRGGRWFTLTSAGGKGPALRALRYQFTVHGVSPVVAAIGNEENDVSLLTDADCRFVIRNPHRGPHPALSSLPGAIVLDTDGPGGWMEMLDRLVPCAQQVLNSRQTEAQR